MLREVCASRQYRRPPRDAVAGAYNATTGLPFYGSNLWDYSVIWDTDYAPVGNGVPDFWGTYLYDTVWALAYALDNLTRAGMSADSIISDGTALLRQVVHRAIHRSSRRDLLLSHNATPSARPRKLA